MILKLRHERPVSWSSALQGWVLVRYDHVLQALADPRLSNARTQAAIARLPDEVQPTYARFGAYFAQSLNAANRDEARLAEPDRLDGLQSLPLTFARR